MIKREHKDERNIIIEKYSLLISEIHDKYLKDSNDLFFWLKDLIDYQR